MTPDVTVIVNAYRTERYIGECLASVLALTGPWTIEVVVIDDCSPDGTAERAAEVAARDRRVRVVRNPVNLQAAASVTRGFAEARGRFIARIDSDDRYRPQFLERTIPWLEAHPGVGLVYGDIAMIDQAGVESPEPNGLAARRRGRPTVGRELEPLMVENFIPAPATIARREAWAAVLPIPDGRNSLDWYCTLNIARAWDLAFVDEVLADYRVHPGNMHSTMLGDGSAEPLYWRNLEEIFAQEDFGGRRAQVRRRVFAATYRLLADQYFGCARASDARRCYALALVHDPTLVWREPRLVRLLAATFVPRRWYERLKEPRSR